MNFHLNSGLWCRQMYETNNTKITVTLIRQSNSWCTGTFKERIRTRCSKTKPSPQQALITITRRNMKPCICTVTVLPEKYPLNERTSLWITLFYQGREKHCIHSCIQFFWPTSEFIQVNHWHSQHSISPARILTRYLPVMNHTKKILTLC